MANSSAGRRFYDPPVAEGSTVIDSWEDVDNADIVYQVGKNYIYGPFVVVNKDRHLVCHVNFIAKGKVGYEFCTIHLKGWIKKIDSYCC